MLVWSNEMEKDAVDLGGEGKSNQIAITSNFLWTWMEFCICRTVASLIYGSAIVRKGCVERGDCVR